MEGTFIRKELIVCVLFLCILPSVIPSFARNTDEQATETNSSTLLVPISEKTTAVSLYVFGRTGLIKQEIVVSSTQATELYLLLQTLEKEALAHPFSARARLLKQDFIDALQGTACVSHDVIKAMRTFASPCWAGVHPSLSVAKKTSAFRSIEVTNITRYLCNVGSDGVGSVLPPIMIPRPRIVCLWAGFSGSSTSIISFLPVGTATITGYQVGLAVGFIGIGAGFAFPTSPAYTLWGYAVMIRMSGENVVTFP
jgi:hypothetical protein